MDSGLENGTEHSTHYTHDMTHPNRKKKKRKTCLLAHVTTLIVPTLHERKRKDHPSFKVVGGLSMSIVKGGVVGFVCHWLLSPHKAKKAAKQPSISGSFGSSLSESLSSFGSLVMPPPHSSHGAYCCAIASTITTKSMLIAQNPIHKLSIFFNYYYF